MRKSDFRPISAPVAVGALLGFVLCGLAGLSCRQNHSPQIEILRVPSSVPAGGTASLVLELVSDQEGDELTVHWSCTSGTLSSTTDWTVTWTAPALPGSATVTLLLEDSRGGTDSESRTITVTPVTRL